MKNFNPLTNLLYEEIDCRSAKVTDFEVKPTTIQCVRDFIERWHYSSNVNGLPSIEEGDYLVAPVFKLEPVNSYKQAESRYDIAKYSIELNFFRGPN